jgi:DMSO/TMAO reductase YedYZ molybdopterin-dependent catalytic subunit
VTARIGLWLGVAFAVCFLTGVLSHLIQHPTGWFQWPTRPVDLYRITQGLHVVSGVAAIPLLLAKLWSVYPKLFGRPLLRSLPHALERGSVLVLIGSAFFELATGLFNAAQNYPWRFFFPPAHYAVAWIALGSLALHVAVKLPIVRAALSRTSPPEAQPAVLSHSPAAEAAEAPEAPGTPQTHRAGALSRRGFLRTTGAAAGVAALATAGSTVPGLRTVSVLSTRTRGALPVNRTARAAGVAAVDGSWRLTLTHPGGVARWSLAELAALPQTTAELPIACVEGWSQSARWTGVRLADLVRLAGAGGGRPVRVESLERDGLYRASELPAAHADDPLTLLALRLDGQVLELDHGYPCRLIAPSRPGVLQTKWVTGLVVV